MPLAGWMLIREQQLPAIYVLVAGAYGAIGCSLGSMLAYIVGRSGGRPFLVKYGKYLLISPHDLDMADRWFERRGSWTAFVSRLLPVVRTFISLPAGIARMQPLKFLIYAFTGSFVWCSGLAYAGYQLGEHWEQIRIVMHPFAPVIIALIMALVIFYLYRHLKPPKAISRPPGK